MSERSPDKRIMEIVSNFISEHSSRKSLITVTSLRRSTKSRRVTIGVTVMPKTQEKAVIDFLDRNKFELGLYLRDRIRMGGLPPISFAIDEGQENHERIEELLKEIPGL